MSQDKLVKLRQYIVIDCSRFIDWLIFTDCSNLSVHLVDCNLTIEIKFKI